MIEFRLLGPLGAAEDGHALPLGGRQQRAVLATLLLHANELVPADLMIDLVWGERPPPTAATVLQVYVSRLRKLLGHELLVTRAPGYVLLVAPEQIDVGRAERLIAAARETHEPARRSALLRDALALWRGPALAEFIYEDLARGEAERLEELRLTTLESAVDAELELGMHSELVGELKALVEAQPLREHARAQLMLALYRAGRQADALSVYRDGRRELVGALGLEPAPSLRRLEGQILAHDPALDTPRRSERGARHEERKLMSALFAEVTGLDEAREPLDPEDAKRLLEPRFAQITDELERFGGSVQTLVGDTLVAMFGAPAAHEDHAERAVRAALAVRDLLAERDEGRIGIRVGVSTGEALVAADRAPAAGGSAFGAVFGRADRVRSAAPANAVVVAEPTYRATREAIAYRPLTGDDRPLMWEALAAKTAIRSERRHAGEVDLIGRAEEVGIVADRVRLAVETASPQLVTIIGAPGIGKTRLLRELAARTAPSALWLQGRSIPYGDGVAYWALAEAVKDYAGILDTDTPDEAAEKVRDVVEGTAPDGPEAVENQLRVLLGLKGTEVATERATAFAGWRRFLEAIAAAQPVVLAFEDLHWADEGLLDFVEHVATSCAGVPLVLACTARPELLQRRPAWGAIATRVDLSPLSDEEIRALVGALLTDGSPVADVEDWVVSRVGGNPLFVEEYVRTIVGRGLLRQTDSGWRLQAQNGALPESVHNIIAARLDALPPDAKALLQDAAVIGKVFWPGAVAAIGDRSRLGCEAQLEQLVGGDFVRRNARSAMQDEAQYTFKHVLIRDVAYAQISRRERSAKHKRAAEWIESHARDDDSAELMAHHYVNALELAAAGGVADRPLAQRAVEVLWRAGERARRLYANDDAATYFRKAWSLVEATPTHDAAWPTDLAGAIQESLGDVLELTGTHADGEAAFAAALRLLPDNDRLRRARLLRKQGLSRQLQRRMDDARVAFAAADDALGDEPTGAGWWRERCEIAIQRLQLLYFGAPLETFAGEAERVRPLVETRGTPAQRSFLFNWLAMVAMRRDRYVTGDEALAYERAALAAALETKNASGIAFVQFGYGFCLLWGGQLDQAEKEMREALALAERSGDVTTVVRCLNYLGVVERKQGHVKAARKLANRTLEMAQQTKMLEYVAQARATLSWASWRDGDHDRAAEQARSVWTGWDDFFQQRVAAWMPLWPLLAVSLARGVDADAVEHARTILDPTRQPMPPELETVLADAVAVWDRGDARDAHARLERATALAVRDGYL